MSYLVFLPNLPINSNYLKNQLIKTCRPLPGLKLERGERYIKITDFPKKRKTINSRRGRIHNHMYNYYN